MELWRFAADYGTLPAHLFSVGHISDPAELLRTEETYRVLRLCGIAESENGETASDWELFRSVGRALPMLVGHPMRTRILRLLKDRFGLAEPLCEENCERLWRAAIDFAQTHPIRMEDALPKTCTSWLPESLALPETLPPSVRPALPVNLLLCALPATLAEWRASIRSTVDEYRARGSTLAVLRLGSDFSFVTPDPYHVGLYLRERHVSREGRWMLTAQLIREVCVLCREAGMCLLLETACDVSAVSLLEYVQKNVGLPQTVVTASEPRTREELIARMQEATDSDVRLAMRLPDLPSCAERAAMWSSICARYPLGRLLAVSAADLRMIEGVWEELERELSHLS